MKGKITVDITPGTIECDITHRPLHHLLAGPHILFRCIFCGREFETVEECNACEERH